MIQNLKAKLVNESLTIVLPSGEVLFLTGVQPSILEIISNCTTEAEVKALIVPELTDSQKKEVEEIKKDEFIKENFDLFQSADDFEVRGEGLVYLKNTKVSIPKLLASELLDALKENNITKYESLKNFWMLALLNPNSQAREGLFDFLRRGSFKITASGMVLAYRRVVSKKTDNEALVGFISNQYIKIKTVHKKDTAKYNVFDKDGVYRVSTSDNMESGEKCLGTLKELYLDLPNMQQKTWTDQYSQSTTINLGVPVSMDRKQASEDTSNPCASGLHLCSLLSDYASFGDTSLLVAFSPRNVVSVPKSATTKMRVCEYVPIAVLEDEDSTILEDADTLELVDEYFDNELEVLLKMQNDSSAQELKQHYLLGDMKQENFDNIMEKLVDYKEAIKNRVVNR